MAALSEDEDGYKEKGNSSKNISSKENKSRQTNSEHCRSTSVISPLGSGVKVLTSNLHEVPDNIEDDKQSQHRPRPHRGHASPLWSIFNDTLNGFVHGSSDENGSDLNKEDPEEEGHDSERLAMSVEPRSIPKRFNNSRKEKEAMNTSCTPDLDKVPKLRTSHSDKGNQTNNTQC